MTLGTIRSYNILTIILNGVLLYYILVHKKYCSDSDLQIHQFHLVAFASSLLAGCYLVCSFFQNIDTEIKYWSNTFLSYLVGISLINAAISLLKQIQFIFSISDVDKQILEFGDGEILYFFMSYSEQYQNFIGYMMILSAILLFFRSTRLLGAFISTCIFTNIFVLNYYFNICQKLYSGTLLLASIIIVLAFSQLLFSIFSNKVSIKQYRPYEGTHLYKTTLFLKALIIIGLLSYYHFKKEKYTNWLKGSKHEIVGAWKIEEYAVPNDSIDMLEAIKFMKSEVLYFNNGKWGYIKMDNELSKFKFLIDSSAAQFELYDFHKLRKLDLRGKYQMPNANTLLFKGRNNKDSVELKMIRDKRFDRYLRK